MPAQAVPVRFTADDNPHQGGVSSPADGTISSMTVEMRMPVRIQSLWQGYGELVRGVAQIQRQRSDSRDAEECSELPVVIKVVSPPPQRSAASNLERLAHRRKLASYLVEVYFYRHNARHIQRAMQDMNAFHYSAKNRTATEEITDFKLATLVGSSVKVVERVDSESSLLVSAEDGLKSVHLALIDLSAAPSACVPLPRCQALNFQSALTASVDWLALFHAATACRRSSSTGPAEVATGIHIGCGPAMADDGVISAFCPWARRGTYWYLATRPQEAESLRNMTTQTNGRRAQKSMNGPAIEQALCEQATRLDAALDALAPTGPAFSCLVHGDAKVANFLYRPLAKDVGVTNRGMSLPDAAVPTVSAVGAVDFQYVGRGVGVQDLVYVLSYLGDGPSMAPQALRDLYTALKERYFERLSTFLGARFAAAGTAGPPLPFAIEELVKEWRRLFPVALADFARFYCGWAGCSVADGFSTVEQKIIEECVHITTQV